MLNRNLALFLFSAAALLAQPIAQPTAQPAPTPEEITHRQLAYTLAHYTKYELKIPMRDGVRLFAAVYVPKDSSQPYPMIMTRTPYSVGPYGIDN